MLCIARPVDRFLVLERTGYMHCAEEHVKISVPRVTASKRRADGKGTETEEYPPDLQYSSSGANKEKEVIIDIVRPRQVVGEKRETRMTFGLVRRLWRHLGIARSQIDSRPRPARCQIKYQAFRKGARGPKSLLTTTPIKGTLERAS